MLSQEDRVYATTSAEEGSSPPCTEHKDVPETSPGAESKQRYTNLKKSRG